MSKIVFVIVGWNNRQLLNECFKSIFDQSYKDLSIIYVDNHSSDDSVDWTVKNYPAVKVLALDHNSGFAVGNNVGISQALSDKTVEFIGLLNTDARLAPDWVANIVEFAKQKPRGACFQGTTFDYYNHHIIDSTHIYVSRNGQGTQGNWRRYYSREIGPKKIFGVNAAACLISRRFIEAQPFSKLFDETMYMYLEDIDLAARSTVMGWDNYLVPSARAYHMGSVSSKNQKANFSLYMTFRNNSAALFKNYPFRLLLKILPRLIKGDLDTLRTLWRRDQKPAMWAVIRGRLIGIARLPLFIAKRLKMSQVRQINAEYLWWLMKNGY